MSKTLPPDWKEVPLGDVAEVITGNTPSRANSDYYGGDIPWVKPANLSHRFVSQADEYLTEKGVAKSRLVPAGSVLVSCIGTIGEVAIAKTPLCFNQQINAVIPNEQILSSYLYWSLYIRAGYMKHIAAKTAVPILNKREFSKIRIPLLSLAEQTNISVILDSVEKSIEQTENAISKTGQLRDALLHELLDSESNTHTHTHTHTHTLLEGDKIG